MIGEVIVGEVLFVADGLPPEDAVYQRSVVPLVPGLPVTVPLPHNVVLETDGLPGTGLMVNVTATRDPVDSQPVVVL